MITKQGTKTLYYLDRDTDVRALVDEMLRDKRAELFVFLNRQHERLQEKDVVDYFTIEDVTKLKDGELEKMMRFFRGAVVPYYIRQSRDWWLEGIPSEMVFEATNEMKRMVGFIKYDSTGHQTDEVNSLTTFERVKDFAEFLEHVKQVCFDDNAYIFPDSEHFRKLEKEKGRTAAQRQVFLELHEKVKNQYQGREII